MSQTQLSSKNVNKENFIQKKGEQTSLKIRMPNYEQELYNKKIHQEYLLHQIVEH